jgi:hypothetical protein
MNNIVRSNGHAGRFQVGTNLLLEQIIFAGSHPGLAGSPVERDRILAYVTVSNSGPRAIRVFWDGPPPHYQTGVAAAGGPISASDQYAPVMPNNSITVAVSRAVKVLYAPDVDPQDTGDLAEGAFVVSWCCPTWTTAPQPVPVPAPAPKPAPPVPKPMG